MAFFLGLDLGASQLKATLIDENAQVIASERVALPTHTPAPQLSEQDPASWRTACQQACAALHASHPRELSALAAISISGGAHIAVLCDGENQPLARAILWSDQRATPQAQDLRTEAQAETISGNRPNATWTLPQLMWRAEHTPQIIAQCQRLYFAKDWLRAALTDIWQTDKGELAASMMGDYRTNTWHAALVAKSGLPAPSLPPIAEATALAGTITRAAAAQFKLPFGVAVYQGTIDTSLEWLCCAPLNASTASLKLASAGVLAVSRAPPTSELPAKPTPPLSFYPHILPDTYYDAAGMNQCTTALDWVRRVLLRDIPQSTMEHLAQEADTASALFHPYLAGERAPLWRDDLTASLSGLNRASNRGTIARAAYEGVGFAFMDIWHDMARHTASTFGAMPDALHLLGGGAASDFWCQMLSDMLGVPLMRGKQTDASFAAALLAAHAHGAFSSLCEAAEAGYEQSRVFSPDSQHHARYNATYEEKFTTFLKT